MHSCRILCYNIVTLVLPRNGRFTTNSTPKWMYFPPAEMGVRATSSNASEQLFGNTTDYDEETEDLLMFHCLHADYHGIDLHLYEHLNDNDGVQLATPEIL